MKQPLSMLIFDYQQAEKSPQNQHVLSLKSYTKAGGPPTGGSPRRSGGRWKRCPRPDRRVRHVGNRRNRSIHWRGYRVFGSVPLRPIRARRLHDHRPV